MSEQDLITLANDFDNFFIDTCMKYELSGVDMSAVILARMSRLSKEIGYDVKYQKLIVDMNVITATADMNNVGSVVH